MDRQTAFARIGIRLKPGGKNRINGPEPQPLIKGKGRHFLLGDVRPLSTAAVCKEAQTDPDLQGPKRLRKPGALETPSARALGQCLLRSGASLQATVRAGMGQRTPQRQAGHHLCLRLHLPQDAILQPVHEIQPPTSFCQGSHKGHVPITSQSSHSLLPGQGSVCLGGGCTWDGGSGRER